MSDTPQAPVLPEDLVALLNAAQKAQQLNTLLRSGLFPGEFSATVKEQIEYSIAIFNETMEQCRQHDSWHLVGQQAAEPADNE